MSDQSGSTLQGVLVEEEVQFTLVELSVACHADMEQVVALVEEGVLTPRGEDVQGWRFEGTALSRARAALRLTRDLELGPAGVALVLDLLDEIEVLKSKLRRANLA
ncbi:MerR family transcriptional regulator [Cupriavidus sp. SK-3]|uniref:chaperone modulator CbpM n=1 Tax=Cupriavidus sp. SK-3 TaxID=1470558 RepID=UPI00044F318D|nr:chaperone modulator CbpM [Cupriavidus sp. SK-3]KDP83714.1 MerR family transcriptional regulator [Cupriavidus sp. SK-3]